MLILGLLSTLSYQKQINFFHANDNEHESSLCLLSDKWKYNTSSKNERMAQAS